MRFAAYDPFGEQLRPLLDIEEPPPTTISLGGRGYLYMIGGPISDWQVRSAVARDGSFYVTASREYQLHAYGERPWSLRVAWPREAVTQEHMDVVRAGYREGPFENVDLSGVEWSDRFIAISGLAVDVAFLQRHPRQLDDRRASSHVDAPFGELERLGAGQRGCEENGRRHKRSSHGRPLVLMDNMNGGEASACYRAPPGRARQASVHLGPAARRRGFLPAPMSLFARQPAFREPSYPEFLCC
jgi:hypothetical protein